MTWIDIPFEGGQRDDVSAQLMPDGGLVSVRNLRRVKTGRWAKRTRYNALSMNSQHTGSSAAIPANTALNLASIRNDRLVLAGAPARLYSYAEDLSRVVPFDADLSSETWAPPTFAAPERTLVQTQGLDDVTLHCNATTLNDYTVVAAVNAQGHLVAYVYSEADGGVFLHADTLDSSGSAIRDVQLAAVGSYIVCAWVAGSALKADTLDATNTTGLVAFTGSPTTIAATILDGIPCLRARTDSATPRALFGYQHSATGVTVEQWSVGPLAQQVATASTASASGDRINVNVYANQTDNVGWAVWVIETISTHYIEAKALDGSFGSGSSVVTLYSSSSEKPFGQPAICKGRTTTEVLIAWQLDTADTTVAALRSAYLSTTPAASGLTSYYGWYLVSDLFRSPYGGTDAFVAARPARNVTFTPRASYYLLRVDPANATVLAPDNIVHARFAEQAAHAHAYSLACVSQTAAGKLLLAAPMNEAQLSLSAAAWRFDPSSRDRGVAAQLGSGLYFSGGATWRWDGAAPRLAGFPEPPEITGATYDTTGGLTQLATYSWCAVYEREEADGSLTLSEPSLPFEATLSGANDIATISVRGDPTQWGYQRIRLYRTLPGGGVFYYVKTHTAACGWGGTLSIADISDGTADSTIDDNHVLYTQVQDELGRGPAPGCRGIFRAGARLWTFGHEDGTRARCSAEHFAGESACFPFVESFAISAPEDIIGGASLDSVPVFFTNKTIMIAVGPGPDFAGNGAFETREIPSDVSLVPWGQRSLVECAKGLVFQSNRGLFLLPRGFGAPQFVGSPVRDVLAAYPYLTSGVLDEETQELRFTAVDSLTDPTAGVMLIWDLDSGVWGVSDVFATDDSLLMAADNWGGAHAVIQENLTVLRETAAFNTSSHLSSHIQTGDVRPGLLNRYGRCRSVELTAEYRASCVITIEASLDGGLTFPYSKSWDLAARGFTAGQVFNLRWHLPRSKATRFQFRVSDDKASGGSEGVIYLGLSVDIRQKERGSRQRAPGGH